MMTRYDGKPSPGSRIYAPVVGKAFFIFGMKVTTSFLTRQGILMIRQIHSYAALRIV